MTHFELFFLKVWGQFSGWRGRWEGGSGWGIHVNPWLIHVNAWQKPLQYCKVISLQLIKKNIKKNKIEKKKVRVQFYSFAYENPVFLAPFIERSEYPSLTE